VVHLTVRPTPVRLTSLASPLLARRWLLLPALAYILAGLYFRDPWKTDDALGLAAMLTAASHGLHAWLLPQVGQFVPFQSELLLNPLTASPLATWVGALCISLFSGLFEFFLPPAQAAVAAARLANLLWFGVIATAVWQGAHALGRRPQAQPLALPFGGEPSVRQYGRLIADIATLLTLVTAGLMWRLHESSDVPALIACQALAFWALAVLPARPRRAAWLPGLGLALALAGAFLTRGLVGALPLAGAALGCCLWPRLPLWSVRYRVLGGLLLALMLGGLWAWLGWHLNPVWMQAWWRGHLAVFQWPRPLALLGVLRDLPWFLWPTWPFALMALWRWRRWLAAPQALHIWLPFMLLVWPLALLLFLGKPFEPEYSLTVIACAVLMAFALPTLRRGWVNSLDWFAVMCFSLACATVWLGWVALHAGWPAQIARNIARQTQGFVPAISWSATALAVMVTAGWLALVTWRLRFKPAALWRGALLYAGGAVATWLLLAALWMPALDYARSYRPVSRQLAAALTQHQRPGECLGSLGLGSGQRASFLVFDGMDVASGAGCPLLLQQTSQRDMDTGQAQARLAALGIDVDSARLLWSGKRGADRRGQEVFRLLRIAAP